MPIRFNKPRDSLKRFSESTAVRFLDCIAECLHCQVACRISCALGARCGRLVVVRAWHVGHATSNRRNLGIDPRSDESHNCRPFIASSVEGESP